jgi:hypothetical protein
VIAKSTMNFYVSISNVSAECKANEITTTATQPVHVCGA